MKSKRIQKGFTLIELLVVVSIIGVLATIVLSSLSAARDRAKDAKIKTLMNQMRTQAELFNLTYGSYNNTAAIGASDDSIGECNLAKFDGTVFDDATSLSFHSLFTDITDITETLTVRIRCVVGEDGNDAWGFAAPLFAPVLGTTGWCVDSSGNSKSINADFTIWGAELGLQNQTIICP